MRVVALDVGEVRIGVAVCDELELAVRPVATLRRSGSLKRDIETMAGVIREQTADLIVIGLPLSLDGEVGSQARRVQGYGTALAARASVPVVYFDESMTSVEANDLMVMQGVSRAKRREKIDQIAAALILEGFLRERSASRGFGDRGADAGALAPERSAGAGVRTPYVCSDVDATVTDGGGLSRSAGEL